MVDVSARPSTQRVAVAEGRIVMRAETLRLALSGNAKKGDVFGAARIAGIMAAKKTARVDPALPPLALTKVSVDIEADAALPGILVRARAKTLGNRGRNGGPDGRLRRLPDPLRHAEGGRSRDADRGGRLTEKTGGKSGTFGRGGLKNPRRHERQRRHLGRRGAGPHPRSSPVRSAGREVPLARALGRTLASDLVAKRTQPPAAVSAMDGYAVRARPISPACPRG